MLLGVDGRIHGPMTERNAGLGKRGWLSDFSAAGNAVSWDIDVPEPDVYEIAVLGGGSGPADSLPKIEVAIGEASVHELADRG